MTKFTLKYHDIIVYDEMDEFLKRYYMLGEYNTKIAILTEYYKYHKDIPRLFIKPISDVMNRYHDKKRHHDYIKITKMLKN